MTWNFVSRAEQAEYVSRAILSHATGSIVITGEPGMGRTTFLSRILQYADSQCDEIVKLNASCDAPLITLRASSFTELPDSAAIREFVDAIIERVGGRRLIVAADDAHLMDYSTVFVLRELVRRGVALLVMTRPLVSSRLNRPDPTMCLAHERDTEILTLLPLSVGEIAAALSGMTSGQVSRSAAEAVHAATRGNPGCLRALVEGDAYRGRENLVNAAWDSWRRLAIERTDQLCRLALSCGVQEEIAPIWAMLLLLRGRAGECVAFLESLDIPGRLPPGLAMVHALALTLGAGRPDEASDLLLSSASGDSGWPTEFLLAFRAWILAISGREGAVTDALVELSRRDRATALFIHAAKAVLAELRGRRTESVFHLRRAIASAETSSDDYPWIRPYLQASLIDALMLCGRVKEAVSTAQHFHAHEPSSGWEIAVSLYTQIANQALALGFSSAGERRLPTASARGIRPHCVCYQLYPSQHPSQECARSHTRTCDALMCQLFTYVI